MPFSSGTFSLVAGNPVTTATTISSTWANNTLVDIASGLSACILKDGTQTLTANIPMSNFRFTGLGAGTARTDSAQLGQLQDSTLYYLTSVAGTNTVTGSVVPAITAYVTGQQFLLTPANTNTGATTLNINGAGAGAVQWQSGELTGGELVINMPAIIATVTSTPVFQILTPLMCIPQNSQSTAYTTVLADAGKNILHPTADNNPRTFTINSNANVAFPIGTAITFVNQINTLTIAITTDTMTLAGTASTGSRTLAANGIATALKITSTAWLISGTGLS